MNEAQILRLFWERAENAVTALAEAVGLRLQSLAFNILGNPYDAEECVNDTYLALWNAIPPAKPNPLSAYACRTARNIALKRLRSDTAQKRCPNHVLSLDELAECLSGKSLDETFDARELGRAIDRFLGTLKPAARTVFMRRYWFGDSVTQIAADLSMTQGAVSVQLNRLRKQLKQFLTQEGFL